MFLPVDPSNGLPIYRQIMDQLRRMIAAGTLRPGDRVPSVRELSTTLQINHLTVARAYQELEREGVLAMRRGIGNFVAGPPGGGGIAKDASRDAVRSIADRMVLEAIQGGMTQREAEELLRESWVRIERGGGRRR